MASEPLPLIDLHRHLDGNIRPQTIWQLIQQHNIDFGCESYQELLPMVQIQENEPNLMAFLSKLDWGAKALANLEAVEQIAYENVEDAFHDGIDYCELRFSPYHMGRFFGHNLQAVTEAVIQGVKRGNEAFGVKTNLIGIMSRTFGVEHCMDELNAFIACKNDIIAIDLAGDEKSFAGELFVPHFNKGRDAGFAVTVHAGEAAGASSVWQAIKELGATRIGHGIASVSDPKLMEYLAKHDIHIENCLTSNYQTCTVKHLPDHPVKVFLAAGISVNLNTDDPAISNISLQSEFEVADKILKLNQEQMTILKQNSLNKAFISEGDKKQLFTSHKLKMKN